MRSRSIKSEQGQQERPVKRVKQRSIRNRQVKEAFYKKEALQSRNLYSDGKSLWSYGWWEIARWVKGEIILRHGLPYSHSTHVFHQKGLRGKLAKHGTPKDQGVMNI